MTERNQFLPVLNETLAGFSPFYRQRMLQLVQEHNAPANWFALRAVRARDPRPFTLDEAVALAPYSTRGRQNELYEALVADGCLEKMWEGSYRLTERGRTIIEGFFSGAHEILADYEPLPEAALLETRDLLAQVLKATLALREPSEKRVLQTSRWTDPGPEGGLAAQIDQYVTDLLLFRDDAHRAAWQQYEVVGQAWETLTYVWNEQAGTAAELAEQLANRGHNAETYEAALQELAGKGWVVEKDGRYQMTEEGRKVREAAEEETDRLHYAGWSALSEKEEARLLELLTQLNQVLKDEGVEKIWAAALGVSQGIFPITRGVVGPSLSEHFDNPASFFPLTMAVGNAPAPFSPDDYRKRFPYTNPDRPQEILQAAAEAGHLSANGSGYRVTEKGQKAIGAVNDVFYSYLGELETLEQDDMERLADFLKRVVEASLATEEPAEKWATVNSHSSHAAGEYAPLARIDQYLDDLNAFRDDAHLAAWQHHDVSGRTWETFSFVWRGEVTTAEALAERLTSRGYDEADYAQSLTELVEKGWIERTADGHMVTAKGEALRREAERATNSYFFAPWNTLTDGEKGQMHFLLLRLKLRLQALAEEVQEATPA